MGYLRVLDSKAVRGKPHTRRCSFQQGLGYTKESRKNCGWQAKKKIAEIIYKEFNFSLSAV